MRSCCQGSVVLALWTHAVLDIGSLPAVFVVYFCLILAFWEACGNCSEENLPARQSPLLDVLRCTHVLPAVLCQ